MNMSRQNNEYFSLKSSLMRAAVFTAAALTALNASLAAELQFTPVQTDLFSAPYGQSNAWGDFDNDNDLDLLVVFLNEPVRLYENRGEAGIVDVAAELNLPAGGNPRSIAWGDYDNDGDQDIYIGYGRQV